MAGVLKPADVGIQNISDIRRAAGSITALTIINTGGIAECDAIDFRPWAGGSIRVPANVTTLTWYGATSFGGTYTIITDAGTLGVQTVVASRWNKIPDQCFAFSFLKCLPNADPTAAEAAIVALKA